MKLEPVAWATASGSVTNSKRRKEILGAEDVFTTPLYAIPPGYKVVPVEPTEAMLVAGGLEVRKPFELSNTFATRIYKAMITAIEKEQ